MSVFVCVFVSVRVCVHACPRVCVCVCVRAYETTICFEPRRAIWDRARLLVVLDDVEVLSCNNSLLHTREEEKNHLRVSKGRLCEEDIQFHLSLSNPLPG